ncbi:hypothetical protein, variant, partial [Sphaeroforma arctica JP610]
DGIVYSTPYCVVFQEHYDRGESAEKASKKNKKSSRSKDKMDNGDEDEDPKARMKRIKKILEREEKREKSIQDGDERKRKYNSFKGNNHDEPTEEEMEAWKIKKAKADDPMAAFM